MDVFGFFVVAAFQNSKMLFFLLLFFPSSPFQGFEIFPFSDTGKTQEGSERQILIQANAALTVLTQYVRKPRLPASKIEYVRKLLNNFGKDAQLQMKGSLVEMMFTVSFFRASVKSAGL